MIEGTFVTIDRAFLLLVACFEGRRGGQEAGSRLGESWQIAREGGTNRDFDAQMLYVEIGLDWISNE